MKRIFNKKKKTELNYLKEILLFQEISDVMIIITAD